MNSNCQSCTIGNIYEAKTINEFKEKVKELGDSPVYITFSLYHVNGSENPGLILESKNVRYERRFGFGLDQTEHETIVNRMIDCHHKVIKDLYLKLYDEKLSPKMMGIQYFNRNPEEMLDEDFAYFYDIAALKGKKRTEPL